MTEILGSDDSADPRGRRRFGEPTTPGPVPEPEPGTAAARADRPAELPVELLGEGWEDQPEPAEAGHRRMVLAALGEPGSLAVASGLCLVSGALAGPSYRFDAYPFNLGVQSLQNLISNTLRVHPLHDYLVASAPSLVLGLAGALTAVLALVRGRHGQPGWVRPLAAGALLVSLIVLALLGLGAYRTSTYDLDQSTPGTIAGAAG